MSHIEKEKLIKADIASIENRVRHAFNQGYDLGFKDGRSKQPNCSEIPTGSTTKNDLGVDLISREQALVAIRNLYPGMPRVDFNGSLRKWVDKYKPYIECDDAIKQLPSVTPQEPKVGHWILRNSFLIPYKCSECNYESERYDNYCPNCGAKMVEPQER